MKRQVAVKKQEAVNQVLIKRVENGYVVVEPPAYYMNLQLEKPMKIYESLSHLLVDVGRSLL